MINNLDGQQSLLYKSLDGYGVLSISMQDKDMQIVSRKQQIPRTYGGGFDYSLIIHSGADIAYYDGIFAKHVFRTMDRKYHATYHKSGKSR